ncbi:MFS transporter [Rhodococcoides kyotonense]|uniref:Predicted arabinose efflux permease, MFS family n=1 Tax=Rhodococcoides kyotonense TaxID=398843 RepID=A0A239DRV4_9NOCA|nr:MFS transporter [Rhodococcus kyotonensis]SNS35210.1 Predicted arabinose efflux permease, MFS family [Rhodococcus kyotonensis]
MTTTTTVPRTVRANLPGLISLALASCLAVTTEMLPVGLLPSIGSGFGVAESTAGLLVSLYAGMVALLAVPLTIVTRRLARKPLLLATIVGYVVSNAVVALAPTFAVVVCGRAVGGAAHALFFSLCIGYAPRLVDRGQVGKALALATGGASVGFVLGVPVSTSLGTALGWRSAFGILAVASAITLVLVARFLPSVSSETPERPEGVGAGRRQLTAVVSSNAVTYIGQYILYTYISLLFLAAGVSDSSIGPLLLICGACGLAGLWFAGQMLDRNPRRTTIVILSVVLVGVLAVGSAHPSLIAVVIAAALWNGAFGGVPSIYQSAAVRTHATSPEMAGAWVNATSNIGIAGGAAIGAALLPAVGVSNLAWVAAAVIACGLGIAAWSRRAFPAQV